MVKIKSFSVSTGDMFYIKDNKNLTIIDCNLIADYKTDIIKEINTEYKNVEYQRFISTHFDTDHINGIENLIIDNFYCVDNKAKVGDDASSKQYINLRDGDKCFKIKENVKRKYLNVSSQDTEDAHINFLWPDTKNENFISILNKINNNQGGSNNISPIMVYTTKYGQKVIWFGDLEADFIEKIKANVNIPKVDIVFAPHHGRKTGALPKDWLVKLNPKIIIIGEGPSEDLNYYNDYKTITQNSAGNITLIFESNQIHIYCSKDLAKRFKVISGKEILCTDSYVGTI